MGVPNVLITEAAGLNTQPNELTLPSGALAVAKNVEITRDGIVEVARGFEDFSENLPDFRPDQLISIGGVLYAVTDSGLWYYDTSTDRWLRKTAPSRILNTPKFATVDSGHVYFTTASHVVYDLNLSTGKCRILAGRVGANAATDGVGDAARFDSPEGICSDGTYIYVCDRNNTAVRKINIATQTVTTLTASLTAPYVSGFYGIVYDSGFLYVTVAAQVLKINASTGAIATWAGSGAGFTVDGVGTGASFSVLGGGICSDGTYLYVCEYGGAIRKIEIASATVTTIVTLSHAMGVALQDGLLYVTTYVDNTLEVVNLSTVAHSALVTGLNLPIGICSDGDAFYLVDSSNHIVRRLYENGYLATLIGVSGSSTIRPGSEDVLGLVLGPSE